MLLRALGDGLSVFGTFVVMIVATIVAFVLWKQAEGGVAGAFILMLARTGVWLSALAFALLNLFSDALEIDSMLWLNLGVRLFLFVATMLSGVGYFLIKTASGANGEGRHG